MKRSLATFALTAPAALLLLLFLAGPLLLLVRVSLCRESAGIGFYEPGTWTFASYAALLGESGFRSTWWFTVRVSVLVTALTLIIAYPLALFIRGLSPRAKALALLAVVLPKLASMLVVIYGLKALLSNAGPVNRLLMALSLAHEPIAFYPNLWGVLIGEAYLLLPYVIIVLEVGLEGIDPELEAAARGLGAAPWRVLRHVTLPMSLPALTVAIQLCFVWALGMLLGPLLLGGPDEVTLGLEVHRLTFERLNWPRGAAAATLMLLTLAACLAMLTWPLGRFRRRKAA